MQYKVIHIQRNLKMEHRLLIVTALYQLTAGLPTPNTCTTPGCLYFVNSIQNNGNATVDPCEDFYEFTCGQWSKNNPVPSDEVTWGTFDIIREVLTGTLIELLEDDSDPSSTTVAFKKIQKIYRNCMDLEAIERNGVEAIISRLRITGGWPAMMALDEWTSNGVSLTQILGYYKRELGLAPLYTIYPAPDPLNSTVNQLFVDVTFRSPFKYVMKSHGRNSSDVVQYAEEIIKVVNILANETGSIVDIADVQKDVNDLVDFEQNLVKLIIADHNQKPGSVRMTINDLQTWHNNISRSDSSKIIWIELLEDVFQYTGISSSEFSDVLTSTKLSTSLIELLDRTPMRTIINYIQWVFVYDVLRGAPEKLDNISFRIWQLDIGVETNKERNETCVEKLHDEAALAHQFVKRHFSPETTMKANETITQIAAAFDEMLDRTSWLKPNEQEFVNDKLITMLRLIGYPDWYNEPNSIDDYYRECHISDSYLENIIEVKRFRNNLVLQKLTKLNDRTAFLVAPTEVNAAYLVKLNAILFTAAVLQKPILSSDIPSLLQYAVFGAVVGHEISHAFDPKGAKYDMHGNRFDWWSNETKKTYDSKVDCFIKQHDNYTIYEDGNTTIKANGGVSKGENVAELHGLKAAYKAYENNKTPEDEDIRLPGLESYNDKQLFFLAYATFWCGAESKDFLMETAVHEAHPISRFRVTGSLSNMEEFSDAFNCPETAKMNPKNKCLIWGSGN